MPRTQDDQCGTTQFAGRWHRIVLDDGSAPIRCQRRASDLGSDRTGRPPVATQLATDRRRPRRTDRRMGPSEVPRMHGPSVPGNRAALAALDRPAVDGTWLSTASRIFLPRAPRHAGAGTSTPAADPSLDAPSAGAPNQAPRDSTAAPPTVHAPGSPPDQAPDATSGARRSTPHRIQAAGANAARDRPRPVTTCRDVVPRNVDPRAGRANRRWRTSSAAAGRRSPSRCEWPSCLSATAAVMISASSASEAPLRIGARRSVSPCANRQVRSWPSAVSRSRSHSRQNGRVTDAMMPSRPTGCGPRVLVRPGEHLELLGRRVAAHVRAA